MSKSGQFDKVYIYSTCSFIVYTFVFFHFFLFNQINIEEKNGDNYLSAGEVRFQENFL